MRLLLLTSCISIATFLLAGCFGNEATPFPPGLEPLEDVTVAGPAPVDGDPFPEALNVRSGAIAEYDWALNVRSGAIAEYDWAQARGYVKAPLSDVYAAMIRPDVVVDHREVARWSVRHEDDSLYDETFVVRNEVEDIITVEFDITWRFGVVEGNDADPSIVIGNWQKTYGTTFIDILRGTVIARGVAPGVTEIAMVEHLRAASRGPEPIESYVRDLFANIAEVSRGRPVPRY